MSTNSSTVTVAKLEPLAILERQARLLVDRDWPLTLTVGDLAPGLPKHPQNLVDLRALLMHPSIGHQERGAIWVRLLELSALEGAVGEEWRIACCALALPGLGRTVARLRREAPGLEQDEVQQCVLAGFWEALADIRSRLGEISEPGRIPASLCWNADRAARRHRLLTERHAAHRAALSDRLEPANRPDHDRAPWLNLDVYRLIEQAVSRGVIDHDLAGLIVGTRLGTDRIPQLAAAEGVDPAIVGMRRRRAELKIAKAFRQGLITGR